MDEQISAVAELFFNVGQRMVVINEPVAAVYEQVAAVVFLHFQVIAGQASGRILRKRRYISLHINALYLCNC